ncbi:tellurium resistance protein terA [Candidatus Magnetobacterium bavaricum]|nr:tellurium resistance protein terA [Candidatus Magnetobacterium bavaricum]
MAELKAKISLKSKGDEAYIPIKQLMVTLKWSANVDLDLMVFYKTKDGRTGGIFTDQLGGSLGTLNEFPFIQHTGDEGVGGAGGDKQETLRIAKLDEIAEIYIITLNYTDASQRLESAFSKYDGGIVIMDDKGESFSVHLNSPDKGTVALIAKIDNTNPMGPKLINENRIMDLETFVSTIPAGNLLTK